MSDLCFVCISCGGQLEMGEAGQTCIWCRRTWSVESGITQFSEQELCYSVFPENVVEEVTHFAEKHSWFQAIDRFADRIGTYSLRYITDESRADWSIILPVGPQSTVLDIGSGWGNIAISLARRSKVVYCGDVNMMNLRLLGCRLSEECISNVHRFLYDPNALLQLPFKDDCVDVVILNGVLEWIGSNDMPDFPERIQSAALKEIWRILKPGGTLYIGIENRYSLSVLRGARLHGELPFVGLMPRWLANAITHLVTGKSHRTYIYSLSGYRRLLGKAGFHIVEFFWPYPSYHNPNYLIPLKPGWAKRFWLESLMVSRSRKFRLTRFLGLGWLPFHWLAFSYSIRCQK